jgi:hypothetical protein
MLGKITDVLGGNLLTGANAVIETIWGSAENDAARKARRRARATSQFAAEFRRLAQRTAWDAFVDGLNRLPRPTLVILVLGYFVLAYADPTEFQILNTALEGVPRPAWYLLGAIVAFYFGARELDKGRKTKLAMSESQFAEQQRRIAELRGGSSDGDGGDGADGIARGVADAAYQRAMASDRPLSDKMIREWNRRHNAG